MASDLIIDLNSKNLGRNSSTGKVGGSSQPVGENRIKKSLGDPPPPLANWREFPPPVRQLFAYGGVLQVLKRKLNALSGEKYTLVPAHGDRVCIDEKGQVHVGLLFLEENLRNEPVLAGVLAHEWGHFPTRRNLSKDLDHLSWDEVYKLRRHEETQADMFCGRALFLLRYPIEPLINYLRRHENSDQKSPKYHTVASRVHVIAHTYQSQVKRDELAGNLRLADAVYGDPIHGTRLIGS